MCKTKDKAIDRIFCFTYCFARIHPLDFASLRFVVWLFW